MDVRRDTRISVYAFLLGPVFCFFLGTDKTSAEEVTKPESLKAPFTVGQAKSAQEAWAKYLKKKVVEEVKLADGVTIEFVLIPPGTYKRGTSEKDLGRLLKLVSGSKAELFEDEMPQTEVAITHPFYLGKYAVTQGQYKAAMGTNPSGYSINGSAKDSVTGIDTSRFPVESVTWDEAVKMCETLSKKIRHKVFLPTEAEWEYACRAGTETFFHFGDKLNGDKANCNGEDPFGTEKQGVHLGRTCKVGSYTPNGFGLYDMHGNVCQWCADYYGPYKNLGHADPFRAKMYDDNPSHVYRGGSFIYGAWTCCAACRGFLPHDASSITIGFRVCFRLD